MKLAHLLPLFALLAPLSTVACGGADDDAAPEATDDDLTAKSDEHWFYTGPLTALENPSVVVSLNGHTVRVTGKLPASVSLADAPHVKKAADGTVSVVYPIATAAKLSGNSREDTYNFEIAKPYRPSGMATNSSGTSFVPWGGFPFLGYNNGIAFHGPITSADSNGDGTKDVWYLMRGRVSHGCNRMNGEHAVELAHILGLTMRKIYPGNTGVTVPTAMKNAPVKVIADYDRFEGKYIDVDYPTDTGVVRPAKAFGDDKVVMFGSWVGTESPTGKDLPPDAKWEAGIPGKPYVFAAHSKQNWVCSAPKSSFEGLKKFAASRPAGVLPDDFCAKRACYIEKAKTGGDPSTCR